MKEIISMLFVLICTITYGQSQYENSFVDIEYLGVNTNLQDYAKIDSSINIILEDGMDVKFYGSYLNDSFKSEDIFNQKVNRITSEKFIAIGIYDISSGNFKAKVKIENSELSDYLIARIETDIEYLIEYNYTFNSQELIDLLDQALNILISGDTTDYFIDFDSEVANKSNSIELVDSLYKLNRDGYFVSLSGIPILLKAGTHVKFTKYSVSCSFCETSMSIPQQGTVFRFQVEGKIYNPIPIKIDGEYHFGGYGYKKDGKIEYYEPELSQEILEDVYLGIYSEPCGYLNYKKVIYENQIFVDDLTDQKYAGIIRSKTEIFNRVKKLKKKIKEVHQQGGQTHYIDKWIDEDLEDNLIGINCDWSFDEIGLKKMLESLNLYTHIIHKNGGRSTTYHNNQDILINYYVDNDGNDQFRMYDPVEREFIPLEVDSESDFLKEIHQMAEASLTTVVAGILGVTYLQVCIVVPTAAGELYGLPGTLAADGSISVATYLVSGDENGLVVDAAILAAPFAISGAVKIVKSSKWKKFFSDDVASQGSNNYTASKNIYKTQGDETITVLVDKNGEIKHIKHSDFKNKLYDEGFDQVLIEELSKDMTILGKDYYKLLDLPTVKAWKALEEAGAISLKTDVNWLSKFSNWIEEGVSQVKINRIATELESRTPLTSSLSTETFATSTLKEGFESGIINFKAWEKINDGIPSLQNNTSKYYHYLRRMSKYADEVDNGGVVKYYRIQTQHAGSHILDVDANNNLIFNNPSQALNLSTDTRAHADYYFAQKLANGDTPYMIEFEVPRSLDLDIKKAAIPQDGASSNLFNDDGLLPKIGDPNQPGDPFELTSLYHNLISLEYISGSAKILPQ